MKRVALLLLTILLLCSCEGRGQEELPAGTTPQVQEESYAAKLYENMKGVWMSQWDLQRVYLDGRHQRQETDFRIRAQTMMQNAVQDGFNTVFLQVRPFGDSFYPSKIFPASAMVVGEYGGEFVYDPVEILVESAHAAGLSIHAWINPFRTLKTEDLEKVSPDLRLRQWYDTAALRGRYLVLQGDGRWYLNPGYSEVRQMVVDGAREVMAGYDFDGLHLDDYFYPTSSEDYDADCFSEYTAGGGKLSISDFRRESVSLLVSELYHTVKEVRPSALFGISPGGNPDRVYSVEYADIYRWCGEEGFVDYICPQIYYGFEHESYPFDKTVDRWAEIVKCDAVRFYVGVTLHKASSGFDQYAGKGAYEWAQHTDILYRSLTYASKEEKCAGVCAFSYQYFRNALTGAVPDYPSEERRAFLSLLQQVVFPASVK